MFSIFNSYRHQMDTYMDTKSVKLQLTEISDSFYNEIRDGHQSKLEEIYGWFPREFIEDQERLITNILTSPAVQCWDILNLSQRSLKIVLSTDIKANKPILRIYDIHELVNFALEGEKDKNYPSINRLLIKKGNVGFILGYGLLILLAGNRLNLYLDNYPNAKKALFVYYFDELDKYSDSSPFAREAVQELENFSRNTYKKKVRESLLKKGKYITDEDIKDYKNVLSNEETPELFQSDLTIELFSVIKSRFTGSISDDVIEATQGNKNENYVPNAVAMKLITRFNKESRFEKINKFTLDNQVKENSVTTNIEFVEYEFTFNDLLETLENQKILDDLTDIINNPFNLTDYQIQVMFLVLEEDKSFQEIGNEMGIKKETAYGHYKAALKKVIKLNKKLS